MNKNIQEGRFFYFVPGYYGSKNGRHEIEIDCKIFRSSSLYKFCGFKTPIQKLLEN